MAVESNNSSLLWDSTSSPLQFQSSSLSNIPSYYDRSLIAPLTLSQRKFNSHNTILQLPPLKVRSTLTWRSSEERRVLAHSTTSSEQELALVKQKFDRLRGSLSQSLEDNRHTFDKLNYKKSTIQQTIDQRDELVNRLMTISIQLNNEVQKSKDTLTNQRNQRDNQEMRQLKLRRTIIRLNKAKDKSIEIIKTNDKANLIEQYNSRLLQLKNQYKQELADRDNQIEELKEKLSEEFNYQSDEHMKLLKATERAYDLESQKRDILQEFIDDYETNIYRARKPCCISTSYRLSKISTQLRLYLIMEITLHELFHSSCSCGPFKRSYQTFMRLHKK